VKTGRQEEDDSSVGWRINKKKIKIWKNNTIGTKQKDRVSVTKLFLRVIVE